MAILQGFPPSWMISPTTYLPDTVEIPIKIINLRPEEKFRSGLCEFMRLSNGDRGDPKAICYKGDEHTSPGSVYGFDKEKEVIWLRDVYGHQKVYPADCCQRCGEKLTSDLLSTLYGDWCANEDCYGK